MNKLLTLFAILAWHAISAQEYFPKNTGVKADTDTYVAFKNAKIYVTPTKILKNGTLIIKNDKVESVGKSVNIPKNAIVYDLNGKTIYPSFIDLYSDFGVKVPESQQSEHQKPQYEGSREGYYWNDHVRPETKTAALFKYDNDKATALLKSGIGVVNTHLHDGVIRGTASLVALNNNDKNAKRILVDNSAQHFSIKRSKQTAQMYPTSSIGAYALIRQVYNDADWYAKGNTEQKDRSLEAFNVNKNLPQIFEADSKFEVLRADKVGDEFGVQYTILSGGDEFERINDIKASNAKLIIPVNFPDAYDVENPLTASVIELADLKEWNQKPANAKLLDDNNIEFAFTSFRLKDKSNFIKNISKAIGYGLSETKALEALTTIPAKILNQSTKVGNLNAGSHANFFITDGNVFDKSSTIFEHWTQGQKHAFKDIDIKDVRGTYELILNNKPYTLDVKGSLTEPKIEATQGSQKLGAKLTQNGDWVTIVLTSPNTKKQEFIRIIKDFANDNYAKVVYNNGKAQNIILKRKKDFKEDNKKEDKKETPTVLPVTYPNMAYGFKSLPKAETILFKNATVWTSEDQGILENTDVLIKNGKIANIGKNLSSSGAKVIDATGKHLTAGIVDEHSHIATDAVNEAGHNSTAEVTIEDVVNSEDISIYQNLAGGVTSIQILHGSANPIGGRSAIIKLKWGESPDQLIYKNSPKFIKFALGENVKQSNWGDMQTVRFPQTRMGVEQVYIDYFTRAKAYDAKKKSGQPYRKDLELETLAEILNKERFISCHSYVQSEINMLMKVAEKFNFNINTFTHILEGYKVADKMKVHGVAGSTFSDWWAYKYEVNDAIPFNAAIMHNAGVLTGINSDDAEMSRRLNQEAAKTIKYGGVSEEDAWKFVTINPAKMLHIDDRVGSIKKGKDADVVLWSDNPLSVYAKAEKTIIDGKVYFDIERDKQMRVAIVSEKAQLINDMLKAKHKGLKTQPISKKEKTHFHCDSE